MCFLGPAPAVAQDPEGLQKVRITDVVLVLVRRSPQLALARADASIAHAEERVAAGREDWTVNGSARYSRNTAPPQPGQPVQLLRQERTMGDLGLSRVLPTGGQLNLTMQVSQQKDTNRVLPMMPGGPTMEATANATTANARLEVLHPLLRGFGRSVAQADRRKAALAADAASLRTRESATTALRDSLHAYWELVYAALEMEARRASLTLAREQLEETRILVREGVRAPGELKASEYSAAVREEASLASQIQFEQRSLALRKVAGLGLESTDFRLWPVDRPLPEARRYDVTAQVKRGLAHNPQLAALALDDRAAAVDEKVASDLLLPKLDLQVGTGVTGIADGFDQSLSAIDGGQVDMSAGVQFTIELGRTAAHGSREAARQRRRKVNIQREEANREVASAIVLAVHEIDMSGKRLEVASQAVDLARDNLESERARFRVGRSGNFDVLQRQDELDRARLARARAAADYHKAVVTLSALTGDLLEEYDVVVLDQ